MGTGLVYMTASAFYRLSRPPRIIGGVAMLWGFLAAKLRGQKRYDQKYGDPDFLRHLRRYQRLCLLKGKDAATRQVEAEFADRAADRQAPAAGPAPRVLTAPTAS